ncbi:MAG: hypothetical protein COV01_00885 [Candidatus Taylorbacteria bacterium CG10_big_fil_rev_8_21_14_0_10_41_48]|uniref:NADAR domain-containing protein n=1 Tax=Candidatus Taylorbacteria bacterium CG10_big_fil_rev_8_21_14_0_10_41_48 TaxID=1975024 RepID=A0A2M8LD85_9BACT|nr:MAG: hypothetical protein COV01_00885 [Candidatus Taylorbacteria bacterium CG10_big_fil_rev_8_21_14_0_10_41_48]
MKKDPILFYEHEFYVCSNFSSFEVEYKGETWKTAEHAYQASKYEDDEIRKSIQRARSSHDAMKIAKNMHSDKKRNDWYEVKLNIMEEICRAKLSQHFYVQKKLLQTEDRDLIENSPRDSFWGWGENKNGENNLGKIWMKLREELKTDEIKKLHEDPSFQ